MNFLEKHDCRKPADIKLLSHGRKPRAVDAADADWRVDERLGHVLPNRLQLFAVAAPGRVELHKPHALLAKWQKSVRQLKHLSHGICLMAGGGQEEETEE